MQYGLVGFLLMVIIENLRMYAGVSSLQFADQLNFGVATVVGMYESTDETDYDGMRRRY